MSRGISINIGVDAPRGCKCARQRLAGAENDARAMAAFSARRGFDTVPLLAGDARRDVVAGAVAAAAGTLEAGDTLLLTFGGHGCQYRDDDPRPEYDGYDESWCLADGPLLDDRLHDLLEPFRAGVRVVIVSDSCHSGSMLSRFAGEHGKHGAYVPPERVEALLQRRRARIAAGRCPGGPCGAPETITCLELDRTPSRVPLGASVLLLAACGGGEGAYEEKSRGLFTEVLLGLLASAAPPANYAELILHSHQEVTSRNHRQNPGWACRGVPDPSVFLAEPFTI